MTKTTGEESKQNDMTEYQLAKHLVATMDIGDVKEMDKPEKIKQLRHYITIESQKAGKKFSTKVKGDKLLVARVRKETPWDK